MPALTASAWPTGTGCLCTTTPSQSETAWPRRSRRTRDDLAHHPASGKARGRIVSLSRRDPRGRRHDPFHLQLFRQGWQKHEARRHERSLDSPGGCRRRGRQLTPASRGSRHTCCRRQHSARAAFSACCRDKYPISFLGRKAGVLLSLPAARASILAVRKNSPALNSQQKRMHA